MKAHNLVDRNQPWQTKVQDIRMYLPSRICKARFTEIVFENYNSVTVPLAIAKIISVKN